MPRRSQESRRNGRSGWWRYVGHVGIVGKAGFVTMVSPKIHWFVTIFPHFPHWNYKCSIFVLYFLNFSQMFSTCSPSTLPCSQVPKFSFTSPVFSLLKWQFLSPVPKIFTYFIIFLYYIYIYMYVYYFYIYIYTYIYFSCVSRLYLAHWTAFGPTDFRRFPLGSRVHLLQLLIPGPITDEPVRIYMRSVQQASSETVVFLTGWWFGTWLKYFPQ